MIILSYSVDKAEPKSAVVGICWPSGKARPGVPPPSLAGEYQVK